MLGEEGIKRALFSQCLILADEAGVDIGIFAQRHDICGAGTIYRLMARRPARISLVRLAALQVALHEAVLTGIDRQREAEQPRPYLVLVHNADWGADCGDDLPY